MSFWKRLGRAVKKIGHAAKKVIDSPLASLFPGLGTLKLPARLARTAERAKQVSQVWKDVTSGKYTGHGTGGIVPPDVKIVASTAPTSGEVTSSKPGTVTMAQKIGRRKKQYRIDREEN